MNDSMCMSTVCIAEKLNLAVDPKIAIAIWQFGTGSPYV